MLRTASSIALRSYRQSGVSTQVGHRIVRPSAADSDNRPCLTELGTGQHSRKSRRLDSAVVLRAGLHRLRANRTAWSSSRSGFQGSSSALRSAWPWESPEPQCRPVPQPDGRPRDRRRLRRGRSGRGRRHSHGHGWPLLSRTTHVCICRRNRGLVPRLWHSRRWRALLDGYPSARRSRGQRLPRERSSPQ